MTVPLLDIEELEVTFRVPDITGRARRLVRAVRGVSLSVASGEAVGVVGESGSGKSTIARAVVGLERPTGGEIRVSGVTLPPKPGVAASKGVQMVFQDHASTLNPFQTVGKILDDVLRLVSRDMNAAERRVRAENLLRRVGLGPEALERRASGFSGGQRQRISIARGLCANPKLLICDEPTSALDVSIQAQILELLAELKKEGLALVFISHNLAVVRQMADRIVVMYAGLVLEDGPAQALVSAPAHPYTRALIDAAPTMADRGALLDRMRAVAKTREAADKSLSEAMGCPYIDRCPRRAEACTILPPLVPAAHGGQVRCYFPLNGQVPPDGGPAIRAAEGH